MKRILIISLIILSLANCKRSNPTYQNLNVKYIGEDGYNLNWEDIYIPIDSSTYTVYPIFSGSHLSGRDYLCGYNRKGHSIDIFDITNRTFLMHIFLENRGPDGLNELSGFYIHNWDSIFVYSYYELCIIDSAGNIHYKKNLKDFPLVERGKKGNLDATISFNLYYAKERQSVFLNYTPRNVGFCSNEFYKIPFVAEYKLAQDTLELLPINYSEFFMENKDVGDLFVSYVSLCDNNIIYNFTGESNIYLYNLQTRQNEAFGARSSFTKNTTSSIGPNAGLTKIQQHNVESVEFLYTYYDKYRNLFYRLHYGDQKYQISENEFNTYDDKSLYLMIFNKDLELIKELKLDDHTFYPAFFGVTSQGLLLNANNESNPNFNEDIVHFKLLKITTNE